MPTMKTLRPYQQEAVNTTKAHCLASADPALITASVGAGKTLIIADLARWITNAGKRVLVLAHNADLVRQNCEEYRELGLKASTYSAALGSKSEVFPAVFGSEQSVKNGIDAGAFTEPYSLILIDEAHRVAYDNKDASYMLIIEHMRQINPKCRIIGLSGSPFRNGNESIVGPDCMLHTELTNITASQLTKLGFLAPLSFGVSRDDDKKLDFGDKKLTNQKHLAHVIDQSKSKTHNIVADFKHKTRDRKCVIIFATTKRHAEEILAELPADQTIYIHGGTPQKKRLDMIDRAKKGEVRYIVNIDVLTTGFNCPIIDCVVWMRPTESLVLLIQGTGRGQRLYDGKKDCLVLDYAGNLDRHESLDDPMIVEALRKEAGEHEANIMCPKCETGNTQYNRRCIGGGDDRCDFMFTFRDCPNCEQKNDVTRRECSNCNHLLIDHNEKLRMDAAVLHEGVKVLYMSHRTTVEQGLKGPYTALFVTVSHNGKTKHLKCIYPLRERWAQAALKKDRGLLVNGAMIEARKRNGFWSIKKAA